MAAQGLHLALAAQGFLAAQGLAFAKRGMTQRDDATVFAPAQGLQGLHLAFTAQGLHFAFTAQGLHLAFTAQGLHLAFTAQGLHRPLAAQGLQAAT